jgi:putative aminopeptidase FrvX
MGGGFSLDVISLLRELTEAQGVSGQEDSLRPTAEKFFRPLCDEIKYDKLGNLIALKKGTAEGKEHIKIMLAAHMDEIGLVVTKIEEGGFLRFSTIGGFDARTLPGQKVIIHGRKDITGVIGSKSPHITEEKERKKAVEIDKLFIDTGYAQSELLEIVKVGDIISIERSIYELANGCVSGKALDDRAGVVALMYCLHKLQSLHHVPDVYAVATVQEEVGVRGAAVSAYNIAPDLSIAIDVCHGNLPGVSEFETQ